MSIKITQPFSFDSKRPNFERDVIDSSSLFVSQNPLNLTGAEKMTLAANYDVGHIVWDTHTSKYYGVVQSSTGVNECVLVELDFTDTTLSGIAYCISGAATTVKVGIMPGFALVNGQSILLYLYTSNTAVSATLDVNSTGAKPVVIGGSATTATNFKSGLWLCRYDGTNWNCEPTQVQANWNETDATSPSFIQNKPTIPAIRTINHETIVGYTDVNIHDGYYFPNAVTDLDGNWYGAVVIGDQVWLGENMKTAIYPSSGEEIFNGEFDDANIGYFFPMPDELGGFYYNWTATMDGSSDSNNAPSGVKGIAPTGFHIPSKTEFDNLLKYLETQERYNDSITKSLAATSGWTTNQLPGDPSWPAVEIEKNNATGFNSRQGGYYFGGGIHKEESAFYWTTTIGPGGNPFYFEIPNDDSSIKIDEAYGTETFCAVRCVSDLNPVQFRDWYVNTYGTMQHHLDRNGILNTTLTTSQATSSSESLGGIVRLHKVSKTGSYNDLLDTPDLSASLYEEITYSSLRMKIDNSQLVKGKMYRITDYETTTTQQGTYAAGNPFDLVVTAISANELDHRASALDRAGNHYFYARKSQLRKWQIWYDVYNITTLYPWADDVNGKGVIYRMIDEYGNEAPYDFKNIQFENVSLFGQGHYYTFSYYDNGTINDFSLIGRRCHGNVIKKRESGLNFIVLHNGSVFEDCYDNKFDYDCGNNYLISTIDVTFGQRCSDNIISKYCNNIHFGDDCESNMLNVYCKGVVFGDFCCNNNLQDSCGVIEFGNTCTYIDLSTAYCNNIRVGNNNDHIRLYNSTNPSANNVLQNIYIVQGFNHSSNNTYTDISTISRNLNYRTTVGRQTDGSVRIYNEEDEALSVSYATQAGRVDYPLHIGPHDYDGSAEVFVDIYDSDYYFSSDYHGGGATTLVELLDTYITSPQNGEMLVYNNGMWENTSKDTLVCHTTGNSTNQTTGELEYTLDHTLSEIRDAVNDGKDVILIDGDGSFGYIYRLSFWRRGYLIYRFEHYESNGINAYLRVIDYNQDVNTESSLSAKWIFRKYKYKETEVVYRNNDNPQITIDVKSTVDVNLTYVSTIVCVNSLANASTIKFTGGVHDSFVHLRNSTDTNLPPYGTKVLKISRVGPDYYVESWEPTVSLLPFEQNGQAQ